MAYSGERCKSGARFGLSLFVVSGVRRLSPYPMAFGSQEVPFSERHKQIQDSRLIAFGNTRSKVIVLSLLDHSSS